MSTNVLVLVVYPDETGLLDLTVAGRPAGRYLLDSLNRQHDVDVQFVGGPNCQVPTWCDSYHADLRDVPREHSSAGRDRPHSVVIDGAAWFSDEALGKLLDRAREMTSAFRLFESLTGARQGDRPARLLGAVMQRSEALAGADSWRITAHQGLAETLNSVSTGLMEDVAVADLDTSRHALLIDCYASLATVEQWVLLDRAMDAMRRGVRLRDPGRVYIRGEVTYGSDVEIDIDVILEGEVVLGNRVRIGAHSIVNASQIGENACIHPFSLVEQSRVGANGFVGPYGRIRPGCNIGDSVQIGNYVEVKNSQIGAGSRINHHSFIGDAVLDDHVTIGAGTITCNHDGTRTHQTLVGRGAYIGSGCNLVAPLRIGDGATVGAGSTITQDVPAGKLTLARTPQTTVEGWKGPRKQPGE